MEPLKNLLSPQAVERLAKLIKIKDPTFSSDKFLLDCAPLQTLELKQRQELIAKNLEKYMPPDFKVCEHILIDDLKQNYDSKYYSGFILWTVQMFFINRWGQDKKYLKKLIQVLKTITPFSSAEFSIRYVLLSHFEPTHKLLLSFLNHPDPHVRRWVSEGTRPRLPWAPKLDIFCQNPSLNAPIFQALQGDSSLYVRKSVANHLNDISKDNPEFVINWIKKHLKEAQKNDLIMWTFRHALRGLIKKGDKNALALLGASGIEYSDLKVSVDFGVIKKTNASYQILDIEFNTKEKQKIILDLKLRAPGVNAKNEKIKIIKGKTFESTTGVNVLRKKLNLFDNSISKFNLGTYHLDIILNGENIKTVSWQLN